MRFAKTLLPAAALLALLPACMPAAPRSPGSEAVHGGEARPDRWPAGSGRPLRDARTEAFVEALLARLTIEEKVGQMIQGDITSVKPADLRRYPLGSILAGGNSPPLSGNDRSGPEAWIATARAFRDAAMAPRAGRTPIPLLFGVDAVHGNNNVVGATIFPHNIGLGAADDPDLMRRIGRATARETAAAGPDWAFGPTLAVPRDDRWGRTYEGYSEDPAIVARLGAPMIEGLQGLAGSGTIQSGHVAASAKHFLGDGGTAGGIDQGDTRTDEATLIRVHGAGYPPAIAAGTLTVMASYSSWNGVKMHGNTSLLTGVLKQRMGFDGLVVGDWNGHGQVPGCSNTDCPIAFNAGIDIAMAPDSWKGLYESTLAHARAGTIPMARIDDAVRRILRVKARLGLFRPERPWEGRAGVIGAADHRAIAREAVAKSLVLLKNDGVLPIKASARVMVAGPGADSLPMQTGGWTLSWQGDGNGNADFPGAESIYTGIARALAAAGGQATLSPDGRFAERPDAAIVVFGEQPYAEMRGDIRTLEFQPGDKQALALLRRLRAAGVPTVSVFLSGRPLWVNPEINASNAFVAAWLPGSEGGGIADVLIGDADGRPRRDFTGRLSFSWPRTAAQFVLDRRVPRYDPLFPMGHGLSYARPGRIAVLDETPGTDAAALNTSVYYSRGAPAAPFSFATDSRIARTTVEGPQTQEGAVQLRWPEGDATLRLGGSDLSLRREADAGQAMQIVYRLDRAAAGPVRLLMEGGANHGAIDATPLFEGATGNWRTVTIPLRCYAQAGVDLRTISAPVVVKAAGPLAFSLAEARIVPAPRDTPCPGG